DRATGYGMKGLTIDGNNILEVYKTVQQLRRACISEQKPVLLECMTFRMRGHEEASGVKYVPAELFEAWKQKDPVTNYERFLTEEKILSHEDVENIRGQIRTEIEAGLQTGFAAQPVKPDTSEEL